MRSIPVRGKTYVFTDLCKLSLDDSPSLKVIINGSYHPVQTSHVTEEDIIKNCPEWANSLWGYVYTTNESIPIFYFKGNSQEVARLVDHEPYRDPYSLMGEEALWVTPKGSPREQYY